MSEEAQEQSTVSAEEQQQFDGLDSLINEASDFNPGEMPAGETGKQPAEQSDESSAMMCTGLVTVIFTTAAVRRGEHWQLSEQESEQLGAALAAVLDKYMPSFNGGVEAALIMTALVIVLPRTMQDASIKRARLEAEQQDTGSDPGKRQQQQPEPANDTGYIQDKAD